MGYDDSLYYPEPPPSSQPRSRKHGCLFYGCLFAAILTLVLTVIVVVLMFFAYRFVSQKIEEYTDTRPMSLPAVTLPEPEARALSARIEDFKKSVEEGRAATLTLSQDEINNLIHDEPAVKDRAAVEIVGNKVLGQISFPFDFPRLGRRYVNGKAVCRVALRDGELTVYIDELEVKGKPVPEPILAQIRTKNLAEGILEDEQAARILRRLERIEVKDGRVTIESKAAKPAADESSLAETEEGWPADPFAREAVPTSSP